MRFGDSKADHEIVHDQRDKQTPDYWIKRHPDLIRLTGKHPFNCEPSPSRLYDEGYITPNSLFYVRNHGIVPRLDWSTHTLEITGLVNQPTTFTMDQLASFPKREFAATFPCAGNRRREVNLVKQSRGFNWGSAAVSTSVFGGTMLSDLLKACGVQIPEPEEEEWYVHFEGSDELPNGSYSTSVRYKYIMNEANEVLIAYQMNGQLLPPDHGYPIRLLLPGFIGGRMVKWLKKIVITKQESDNWYHLYDNRIVPSHEGSKDDHWWRNPDCVINSCNINSVIAHPQNNEILPISQDICKFRGYAYTGSGNKIIRVELSIDHGESWLMCTTGPQIPSPISKRYWAWTRWSYDFPTCKLLNCKEVIVRAWDSTYNTQPAKITWNVLGQMNNAYFKLKLNFEKNSDGQRVCRFEHPCLAGNQEGGWMPQNPVSQLKENDSHISRQGELFYTHREIKKHNQPDDCWILVNNKVYDVTKFIEEHPGGRESIHINAGSDCTEDFEAVHSNNAYTILKAFYIGELSANSTCENTNVDEDGSDSLVALSPKEYRRFPLIEKIQLNHNTRLFRFKLPTPQHRLGLPVGNHILLKANIGGKAVIRAYTPSSLDDELGHVDLIVKIYLPNLKFPNGGLMSQHLDSLEIDDFIEMKGPIGHFVYKANGHYDLNHGQTRAVTTHIGMIAGGSGITPVFQVIQSILGNRKDQTKLSLIFANRTVDDIFLFEELNRLSGEHPDQFKVCYTITEGVPSAWTHSIGPVDYEMCQKHLPNPSEEGAIILLCGPPGMLRHACIPNLEKLEFKPESIITF